MRAIAAALIALFPCFLFAQAEDEQDRWAPFRFFVGNWQGTEEGRPGVGRVETGFRFIYDETYLEVRSRGIFEPQERNPEGEVHQDVGYISYDGERESFVLREFHTEGYVNQYRLESLSPDGGTFAFVSESIENLAEGWQVRLTLRILDENAYGVTFEIAPPDRDFIMLLEGTLNRVEEAAMELKKLTPNLMVENVNETIEYYRDVLGFELVMTVPEEGEFDWAMMSCGGVELMFQSRGSLGAEYPPFAELEIGGSLGFYIEVAGIDELYAGLVERAEVVTEPHTTFYGMREFTIRDCNGYVLTFAERVEQ